MSCSSGIEFADVYKDVSSGQLASFCSSLVTDLTMDMSDKTNIVNQTMSYQ